MRMVGHAQHDPAEYVPREMFEHWKARDPIGMYEKFLSDHALWDADSKRAVETRIERELADDLAFAEASPFPPPELAEQGVYCEGCHTVTAQWQRPREELTPPGSGTRAEWTIQDFGDAQATPDESAGEPSRKAGT